MNPLHGMLNLASIYDSWAHNTVQHIIQCPLVSFVDTTSKSHRKSLWPHLWTAVEWVETHIPTSPNEWSMLSFFYSQMFEQWPGMQISLANCHRPFLHKRVLGSQEQPIVLVLTQQFCSLHQETTKEFNFKFIFFFSHSPSCHYKTCIYRNIYNCAF